MEFWKIWTGACRAIRFDDPTNETGPNRRPTTGSNNFFFCSYSPRAWLKRVALARDVMTWHIIRVYTRAYVVRVVYRVNNWILKIRRASRCRRQSGRRRRVAMIEFFISSLRNSSGHRRVYNLLPPRAVTELSLSSSSSF